MLFGGTPELMHLGRRNVDFALEWLERQGVDVVHNGVLGNKARRVELDLLTGTASERTIGGP